MDAHTLPPLQSSHDVERVLEFEFVRATENAALNAMHWLGRGQKERGDAAACDAIYGVFDRLDIRGLVVIGEEILYREIWLDASEYSFEFQHWWLLG